MIYNLLAQAAAQAPKATQPAQNWLDRLSGPQMDWLILGCVFVGSIIAGRIVSAIFTGIASGFAKRKKLGMMELSIIFKSVSRPSRMFVMGLAFLVAGGWLKTIDTAPGAFYPQTAKLLIAIAVAWVIYRLVDLATYLMNRVTQKTESKLDDQLLPLLRKIFRILIVIFALWFIAENLYACDLSAIIAGLGIGGLAFAFAAKDMLSNLFGSVTIFADRPFALGDRVVLNGYTGDIIDVGFRTTKIRTLDGHVVTLPNGIVANSAIENVSKRPSIKRVVDVGVTYDTTPAKMEEAFAILRDMLDARKANFHPDNVDGFIGFTDFGASAMNIKVIYWFAPCDWGEFCQFGHDFNMELLTRFNDAAIEFAYPTQTLYVKKES